MVPTRALREKAMQLLAADAATLAPPADANLIILIMEPFTPAEILTIDDLVPATFDGSAGLAVGLGTQPEGLDPSNADSIISILPPAGGFRFETTGTTDLPQTIYGFALVNDDETILLGCDNLPSPVILTGVNQVVQLEDVTFRQLAGSIS